MDLIRIQLGLIQSQARSRGDSLYYSVRVNISLVKKGEIVVSSIEGILFV